MVAEASAEMKAPRGVMLFEQMAVDRVMSAFSAMADPDEVLKKVGMTRAKLRSLETDDDLCGAMDTRREAVIATPWRLEPGGGAKAAFIERQIMEQWEHIARNALSSVSFGYAVGELVYRKEGGRVAIESFTDLPFEWFKPLPDGGLRYFPQSGADGGGSYGGANGIDVAQEYYDPATGLPGDRIKFFLTVRQPSYRNPYGEALYSRLYWPWYFRSHGWRYWMRWLERFGTPFLVGKTNADPEKMASALVQAHAGAALAVGQNDEVTAISGGAGTGHFEAFEGVIVRRYQKLILGQTLTTDTSAQGGGARALGEVHNEVRDDKRRADIRLITPTFQRIVTALWALNGFAGEPPRFVIADDTGLEKARADRDAVLAEKCGIRFNKSYFVDRYDLEETDFEVPEPPEAPEAPEDEPSDSGANGEAPEDGSEPEEGSEEGGGSMEQLAARPGSYQRALDRMVDRGTAVTEDPIPVADIRAAVLAASDASDLEQRLALLLNRDDPAFAEALALAMGAARVLGFVAAGESRT